VILVLTAVALLAACASGPSSVPRAAGHAPSRPGAAGPPPAEHFAAGTTFWPVSQVAVLSDDRTLVAETTWGCGGPPRLVAAEMTHAVVLVLAQPPPPPGPCAAVLLSGPVRNRLTTPLGDRRLLRRTSLTAIAAVYQSKLASVSVLPPGYRFDGLVPGSGFSSRAQGDRDFSTRTFTLKGGAPVTISEATGTAIPRMPYSWLVTATVDVSGHQAVCRAETFDGAVDTRSIAWSAGGRVFVVVSQQGLVSDHVPSQAQLLATARGVH
jgi:hypothetical protein